MNEHLDYIATCVHRDRGRSLRDACCLLKKAGVKNPNGRKHWLAELMAASMLYHEQRERDELDCASTTGVGRCP